jgi:hypothetical protein
MLHVFSNSRSRRMNFKERPRPNTIAQRGDSKGQEVRQKSMKIGAKMCSISHLLLDACGSDHDANEGERQRKKHQTVF